jgi:hypothetical protein
VWEKLSLIIHISPAWFLTSAQCLRSFGQKVPEDVSGCRELISMGIQGFLIFFYLFEVEMTVRLSESLQLKKFLAVGRVYVSASLLFSFSSPDEVIHVSPSPLRTPLKSHDGWNYPTLCLPSSRDIFWK